jgi:predicted nucleic acid-binding protein
MNYFFPLFQLAFYVSSETDLSWCKKTFDNYNFLSFKTVTSSWLDVSKLGFEVSRHGFNPPLADLYIAQCAIDNKLGLISRDHHFEAISKVRKFSLKLV